MLYVDSEITVLEPFSAVTHLVPPVDRPKEPQPAAKVATGSVTEL